MALAILFLVQMCCQLLPEDFHAFLGALLMQVVARSARPTIR
ncbi:hypothetical protein [Collinsella aerofaciens]